MIFSELIQRLKSSSLFYRYEAYKELLKLKSISASEFDILEKVLKQVAQKEYAQDKILRELFASGESKVKGNKNIAKLKEVHEMWGIEI